MDRRNFFKIVSTVSAGVATSACGSKTNQLIPLLVPDHEIVPGEEQWHASVCTECSAGCGTLVRVMAGERVIHKEGKPFRERIAAVKKIEGNPDDAASGGRLCARGHASLQGIYNPDRLRGPMMRNGDRGKGQFKEVSWDEAIAATADKLRQAQDKVVCFSRPEMSDRSQALGAFMQALNAPAPRTASFDGFALEQKAAEIVYGWHAVPVYDVANARYVLGVGADFLGGWVSPVYYARQFGALRQGRSDIRGRLVQAESRMSITAASADEWLPVRPGAEPQFILALMRLLLDNKWARHADALPVQTRDSLAAMDLKALIQATGLDERRLQRIAKELGASDGPLVIAGASYVHSNTLDGLVAAHYLNMMLGATVKPGAALPVSEGNPADALKQARVVLLDGENPVYTMGATLADKDFVVSFSPYIDDSSAFADVILPDHHALESAMKVISPVTKTMVEAKQFVQPLYNTRALTQTVSDLAGKLGVGFAPAAPVVEDLKQRAMPAAVLQTRAAQSPAADQYPFELQPYLSLQYHDGRAANLPWMQELPDPASSAMWDLPLEIDPKSAAKLNIVNGDRVRITSAKGSLDAYAYVHPASLPGVISMAIGQGHTQYGRYASGRGANPLSLIAAQWDETGTLITGGTRVKLERLGEGPGELIQFSPVDREQGPWGRS